MRFERTRQQKIDMRGAAQAIKTAEEYLNQGRNCTNLAQAKYWTGVAKVLLVKGGGTLSSEKLYQKWQRVEGRIKKQLTNRKCGPFLPSPRP